jgi:ABC-type multidrug transport system fused ATPase/permease subunit
VQEALDELMKGKTVLVVAHRLSTIRAADVIVVMGREIGNILEKGRNRYLT